MRRVGWLILIGAGLAGCSGQRVAVPVPPDLDATTNAICTKFVARLPMQTVVGQRRHTQPKSALTAAWGNPPVALRCGVPRPAAFQATSNLVEVDGTNWLPEELSRGWRLTSIGRLANVEITVPADAGPAPSVAAEVATALKSTIPVER